MKLFLAVLVLVTGAVACTQTQNYKTERDEVMKFHDTVMADHGILVNNQMTLDSLLKGMPALKTKFPATDTVKEKVVMKATLDKLNVAEELMNDWMHKFEPDVTGKSNEDAIQYFKAERIKIGKIDSVYKIEIQSSDAYLKQFKK
ncbi:hypothetical protein H7F33_11380 [Pedobacter sp. PAMC26386]|nr:hypothetical protein H7F33_11380 [Pedobacter sp. PAMC26386]